MDWIIAGCGAVLNLAAVYLAKKKDRAGTA